MVVGERERLEGWLRGSWETNIPTTGANLPAVVQSLGPIDTDIRLLDDAGLR